MRRCSASCTRSPEISTSVWLACSWMFWNTGLLAAPDAAAAPASPRRSAAISSCWRALSCSSVCAGREHVRMFVGEAQQQLFEPRLRFGDARRRVRRAARRGTAGAIRCRRGRNERRFAAQLALQFRTTTVGDRQLAFEAIDLGAFVGQALEVVALLARHHAHVLFLELRELRFRFAQLVAVLLHLAFEEALRLLRAHVLRAHHLLDELVEQRVDDGDGRVAIAVTESDAIEGVRHARIARRRRLERDFQPRREADEQLLPGVGRLRRAVEAELVRHAVQRGRA